jgi:predicted GH43/DUF377 family glycosyl hydrolase
MWSAKDRRWFLWYYCKSLDFDTLAPPSLASGYMAMATSLDGLEWTRYDGSGHGGSILGPASDPAAFDSLHLGATDVTWVNGQYWMWYYGGDRRPAKDSRGNMVLGFRALPGLALSRDGFNWTKAAGPGPGGSLFDAGDAAYASWPGVVHDGQKFMMYYTSSDTTYEVLHTLLAYSADGLNWTQQGPIAWSDPPVIWDAKGIIARQVIRNPFNTHGRDAGKWLMIYAGIDGSAEKFKRRSIAMAVSDDGVTWRRLHREPVFTVDASGGWDAAEVTAPHLVVTNKDLRLFYLGGPRKEDAAIYPRGLGLAISTTGDLRDARRYIAKAA